MGRLQVGGNPLEENQNDVVPAMKPDGDPRLELFKQA